VKWYARLLGHEALAARLAGTEMPQSRPYGVHSELHDVADLISPQSYRAAEFAARLARWQRAALGSADRNLLMAMVESWGAQSAVVGKLALRGALAEQLTTLAERLGEFADCIDKDLLGQDLSPLTTQRLARLDAAQLTEWQMPAGELMLAVVAPLLALVRAAKSDA